MIVCFEFKVGDFTLKYKRLNVETLLSEDSTCMVMLLLKLKRYAIFV